MLAIVLLSLSLLVPDSFAPVWTPAQIAALRATPIGQTVALKAGAGDSCNTCTVTYRRVSETEVEPLPGMSCTLMHCDVAPRDRFDVPQERSLPPPEQEQQP